MAEVIPAIDLRSGRCVRLTQGRRDRETSYGDDPVAMARHWVSEGARRLHVVDLDGAFGGRLAQADAIAAVARECGAPVQVGGGLRTEEDLEAVFAAGAARAILGTAALENDALLRRAVAEWGDRVAVALDVRDGQPVVRGWEEMSNRSLGEAVKSLRAAGVQRVVVTDVGRDGTLEGPNMILVGSVARLFGGAVVASGGFAAPADFERARRLTALGLEGVVVGKALYEGRLRLRDAQKALDGRAAENPSRERHSGV